MFKILVIMVTVRIVLCACKTWKFRVTHFAIFHYYDHSTTVGNICLSVYSVYSAIHMNVFYVKLLSNMYQFHGFALI
jgi:hypothetical protein